VIKPIANSPTCRCGLNQQVTSSLVLLFVASWLRSCVKSIPAPFVRSKGLICFLRPFHLAYQLPDSNIFFSEQTSHQQPTNNTFLSQQTSHEQPVSNIFLSKQINTSYQPNEQVA
jgi:hypothetical protein